MKRETNIGAFTLSIALTGGCIACAPVDQDTRDVVVCDDKTDPDCAPDREVVVIDDKEKEE